MNNHQIKTDNSFIKAKILLRLNCIHSINKNHINLIDAFAGENILWDAVKKMVKKNITVLKIEKKSGIKSIYLKGNNIKFFGVLKISNFDIIDMDAYGSPYKQLEIIFEKQYHGIIICTFIQSVYGGLNKSMLFKLGYTEKMIKKIPTLFNKNGFEKFTQYLALNHIEKIHHISYQNKHYLWFKT